MHTIRNRRLLLTALNINSKSMMYKFHIKHTDSISPFLISRYSVLMSNNLDDFSLVMVYNDYNFKKFIYLMDYLVSKNTKYTGSAIIRTDYSFSSRGVFLNTEFVITDNDEILDKVTLSFVLSPLLISNKIFTLINALVVWASSRNELTDNEALSDEEPDNLDSFKTVFSKLSFKYLDILENEGILIDDIEIFKHIVNITNSRKVFDYITEDLRVEVNNNNEMKLSILKLGE